MSRPLLRHLSRALRFALLAAVTAAVATAATPVWSDEFGQNENTAPDSSKWTYDLGGGGWGNNELQTYTSDLSNARIVADQAATDGKALAITARRESNGTYTSARLKTQGKFSTTYGRIEARIKVPSGKGLWSAFWMLGNDITTVGWPACGEIDIMESINANPMFAFGTVHGSGYSGANGVSGNSSSAADGSPLSAAYHTYAVDWSPGRIVWSMDDIIYHTVTPSNVRGGTWAFNDSPFFLLLNLAIGGNLPGYPDDTTLFPQSLLVDYVRVYDGSIITAPVITAQPQDTGAALGASASFAVEASGYGLTYQWFKGSDILADPAGGSNKVARAVKSATAQLWAGTTASTSAGNSVPALPFDAARTTMTVRVFSPDAGIRVRLKVEDASNGTRSCETDAFTTTANMWETLTFNFSNPASGTPALNRSYTYNRVSIFFNFGVPGSSVGTKTYYFDDIVFTGGGWEPITFDSSATTYSLTGFGGAETTTLISGATSATYTINPVSTASVDTYTARITNSSGTVVSQPAALMIAPAAYLSNLSVRAATDPGKTLIAGFVVAGGTKPMLIRAAGPALTALAIPGLTGVADPQLRLYNATPALVDQNDDWVPSQISTTAAALGAFDFPAASKDAALLQNISGPHTAQVTATTAGQILTEVYDAGPNNGRQLTNLSARFHVGAGDNILIAGFVLAGSGTRQLLVRAVGPTLANYGVPATLADPQLAVLNGGNLLASNDDWSPSLSATFAELGAFSLPSGSKDAALLVTLEAGRPYTIHVSGAGQTVGEALVELYAVP